MTYKIVLLSLLTVANLFGITVGEKPKTITIEGENGGLASDGSTWNSSTIKGKVYVLFYVDPDEKDTNSHFSQKLKAKKYDRSNYGSIAIVNLAATWKPNFIIESLLKEKQEKFPDTTYVKDKNSVLVKEWDLADDNSDILIFSKEGNLLFYKAGAMSDEDIQKALRLIEANL